MMAQKKVKNMKLSFDELNVLTKEEIIFRFLKIQEHNIQLKNIISKYQHESLATSTKSNSKPFDFSKWGNQHIFLRFLYLGWDYHGYATVEDTLNTIEHHMMRALVKCRLIESRETAEYHRCGRTDKGVSAFSQVISLKVRKGKDGDELDYCGMLNRLLPSEIKVTGWCPIQAGVSARFNCKSRLYRYFFPKANLDLKAMKESALYLKGIHDFRNLCKMDVANGVTNFTREILDVDVTVLSDLSSNGYSMCEVKVLGSGFLWHQIRCIMAVLLMVGQGHEKPTIIKELLEIQNYPKKPQYTLAGEIGLCLFHTEFDVETPWSIDKTQLSYVISQLQGLWTTCTIKSELVRAMLKELESQYGQDALQHQVEILIGSKKPRQHKPLLSRKTCQSLEDRVEHYRKKIKIEDQMNDCSAEFIASSKQLETLPMTA